MIITFASARTAFLFALLCLSQIFALLAHAATPQEIVVERNVPAKMRDGVILRADIYRPKAEGKYPVLLTRTPYDKNGDVSFGVKAAQRGYVVIAQDVRGRFTSDGEWYTFIHESADGYDTIEWAAALPFSNGKVGMFGGSYVGATQFLAAIASPPHLAGIFPAVTASNYHDGWTYQGGAFEQWFNESWTTGLAKNTFDRRDSPKLMDWIKPLPLNSFPIREAPSAENLAPYFRDWLRHPNYDDYWKQLSIEEHYPQIRVPVFSAAAWYDIFLGGSLKNFIRLKTDAGTPEARRGQRLIVVIGGHAGSGRRIGDTDFGASAVFDEDDVMLRWYDWLLKGESNGVATEKPVKIFVMGKNVWREEDDWPLSRAKETRYFLHSQGSANGLAGNGSLSAGAPANEPADKFVYDPADPVPTIAGPLCCQPLPTGNGPADQRRVEQRPDVLVYTTEAFAQDTEVTGPVSLVLWASTSAVDTDFTGKLVDVSPDGHARNLTEGILRLRYRNSQEKPEPATPGQNYHLNLDLWATSNVFLAGHKLRLEISSSNFPRFDRNLNTGDEQAGATSMVKATNTIFHDRQHPTALILPIIPEPTR